MFLVLNLLMMTNNLFQGAVMIKLFFLICLTVIIFVLSVLTPLNVVVVHIQVVVLIILVLKYVLKVPVIVVVHHVLIKLSVKQVHLPLVVHGKVEVAGVNFKIAQDQYKMMFVIVEVC